MPRASAECAPGPSLRCMRPGLLVPATVIAEVGYFLAREAGARMESLSCGPWLVGTLRPST